MAAYATSRVGVPAVPPAINDARSHWTRRPGVKWGVAAAACVVIASSALFYQTRVSRRAALESAHNGQVEGLTADRNSQPQRSPGVAAPAPPPPSGDQLTATLDLPPQAKALMRQSAPQQEIRKKEMAFAKPARPPLLKPQSPAAKGFVGAVAGAIGAGAGSQASANSERAANDLQSDEIGPIGKGTGDLPLRSRFSNGIANKEAAASQASAQTVQVEVSGAAGLVTVEPHAQAELPLNGRAVAKAEDQKVEVAAAPAQASANTAAKPAVTTQTAHGTVNSAGFAVESAEVTRMKSLRKQAYAQMASNYIPTRWMISLDGSMLFRSSDHGATFEAVPVANNIVLRAVASLGMEVWVAGNAGALYHSVDLGQHWTQVKPPANGKTLTADIVSIEFTDSQHIKLTTSDGKIWTTTEGGKRWQVQ